MKDLWDQIEPSRGPDAVTLRRADAHHPLDFFRGRDHEGRYIFVLQCEHRPEGTIDLPRLAHLGIEIDQRRAHCWELSIKLLEPAHADIFRALCANLMAATEALGKGDNTTGIEIVLARLVRWRDLLRGRREQRLSQAQVIGLFGELTFLRDLVLPRMAPVHGVAAWRGPCSEEQDFQLGTWLVEVKTQLSTADKNLHISSENQLDTASGPILVCHQTLSVADPGNDTGRSLNSLVAEIVNTLAAEDLAALDRFHAVLIESGFAPHPDYDDLWAMSTRSFFNVEDSFPRIARAELHPGVEKVRYEIKASACEPFRVSEATVIRWVFGE